MKIKIFRISSVGMIDNVVVDSVVTKGKEDVKEEMVMVMIVSEMDNA